MNEAIAKAAAPVVTLDQLALVTQTVAKGATPEELKLFLYDCARQGVHPLDKLIHFTKHSGKYTPITSIDFMRIRAADTGEYAGSDDAEFYGEPGTATFAAVVTVWRLVQGQRCPFRATARWAEYKPQNDFMWLKMPHTMLGKCAEALALRKGFPKQLAGLYAKEELEQTDREKPTRGPAPAPDGPAAAAGSPPDRFLRGRVVNVTAETKQGRKSGAAYTKHTVVLESGEAVSTLDSGMAAIALTAEREGGTVELMTKPTRWGADIVTIARVADEPAF